MRALILIVSTIALAGGCGCAIWLLYKAAVWCITPRQYTRTYVNKLTHEYRVDVMLPPYPFFRPRWIEHYPVYKRAAEDLARENQVRIAKEVLAMKAPKKAPKKLWKRV